jgi:hypothetical protein
LTQRVPDFFIVGQPKCGTTALYEMLKRHPQIYMPDVKEPEYFADELATEPPPINLPTTMDHYLSLFADAKPDQLIGEASALYLWSHTAARNIARIRPDARIIAIIREPASFLLSLHLFHVKLRIETEKDLRRALMLEDERKHGRQLPTGGFWRQLLIYSEHMKYLDQLHRYQDAFPADQLLVLLYDDFRADNRASIRTILQFLGLDYTVDLPMIESNQSVRVRARRVAQVTDAVSYGRGRSSAMLKTAVKAVTTQPFRRAAQKAVRDHIAYARPRDPDRKLILELRHCYRAEVVALSEYLGRDLITLWGYDGID